VSKILFINPLSRDISLFVLDRSTYIDKIIIPKGDDFTSFPDKVVEVVDLYTIEEIWCICGPWAFTRMRIVTLTLGALSLSRDIRLKGCHFFDTIEGCIPVIKANESEYIIRGEDGDIHMIPKESLPEGEYRGYGGKNDFTDTRILIEYSEDFAALSHLFEKKEIVKNLAPIYLKAPHITWSKKSMSPS
jgi:hypothetical protein